jgi:hypothetical protein
MLAPLCGAVCGANLKAFYDFHMPSQNINYRDFFLALRNQNINYRDFFLALRNQNINYRDFFLAGISLNINYRDFSRSHAQRGSVC